MHFSMKSTLKNNCNHNFNVLEYFNMLVLKINLKNKKIYYLMYFNIKKYFKK